MDLDSASRVLRVLTAAFPTYPVGEDTAEVYLAMLTKQVRRSDVGLRAAQRWVLEEAKFPKASELLLACKQEAESMAAAEGPPAIMDGSEIELSREENAQRVSELRESMATLFRRPA